jgi:hypothetical protein
MSFAPNGTPWSGPRKTPRAASSAARRAAIRAPSRSRSAQACNAGVDPVDALEQRVDEIDGRQHLLANRPRRVDRVERVQAHGKGSGSV